MKYPNTQQVIINTEVAGSIRIGGDDSTGPDCTLKACFQKDKLEKDHIVSVANSGLSFVKHPLRDS